jgi:putative phosphonate metabolism protein
MAARYAVYYAPPEDSPLAAFGSGWLGREAATGELCPQPDVAGFTATEHAAITEFPRHYVFHGTLKPPFALADDTTADALLAAVEAFAADRAAFAVPVLQLAAIGRFVALVPGAPSPDLRQLAADAVRDLDRFRAPPSEAELARRRKAGLTPRQELLLQQWGYPYVMEEFRFHLTLTGPLDAATRDRAVAALDPLVAPLCRLPLPVDALAVFAQDDRAAPFREISRHALRGGG